MGIYPEVSAMDEPKEPKAPPILASTVEGPRERTKAHLKKILTAAAVSAALQASCDRHGSGYGVVDPMPAPSRCEGTAAKIKAEASWQKGEKGLEIDLVLRGPEDLKGFRFLPESAPDAIVHARGAEIVSQKPEGDRALHLRLRPEAGASSILVTGSMQCGDPQAQF